MNEHQIRVISEGQLVESGIVCYVEYKVRPPEQYEVFKEQTDGFDRQNQ